MNMIILKYVPISGVASVIGSISPTMVANIVTDNIMVRHNDNFSPESGGRVKPNIAIAARRTHGIIRLKK